MYPQLLDEELVLESPVFEQLGVFPDDRRAMLAKARNKSAPWRACKCKARISTSFA